MVEISDIEDKDSLEEWLKTQTREVCNAIAHRAAMRVAPFFWVKTLPPKTEMELRNLRVSRSLLVSSLASIFSSPEISEAAQSSLSDAGDYFSGTSEQPLQASDALAAFIASVANSESATSSAANAASFVTFAASITSFATSDIIAAAVWSSVRMDCASVAGEETGQALFSQLLWPEDENPLVEKWDRTRADLQTAGPGWQFWIGWYEAALAGRPPNWAMLTEVALISADDWTVGLERVNGLIAGIQLKFAIKATPNAEVVSFNSATGKLRVDPVSDLP